MIYAHVDNGIVTALYYGDTPKDGADISAPGNVREGWVYDGSRFLPPLADYKSAAIDSIKAQAFSMITSTYPLATGKQSNMLAAGNYMTKKLATGVALSAEEQAAESLLLSAWSWIDSVRGSGRAAVASIQAAPDHASVDAVVPAWPTTTPPAWDV